MSMREELLEILEDIRPDTDFEGEEALIDDNILESLDIVALVGELNDAFDIEITVDELIPDNFNSVDRLLDMIERLQD